MAHIKAVEAWLTVLIFWHNKYSYQTGTILIEKELLLYCKSNPSNVTLVWSIDIQAHVKLPIILTLIPKQTKATPTATTITLFLGTLSINETDWAARGCTGSCIRSH